MSRDKEHNRELLKEINSKVLELININDDDDVNKPVRFYFYATNENSASDLAIELHKMGCEINPLFKSKPGGEWSVIAQFEKTKIAKNNIDDLTDVMISLAEEHNCVYDGWETEMKD